MIFFVFLTFLVWLFLFSTVLFVPSFSFILSFNYMLEFIFIIQFFRIFFSSMNNFEKFNFNNDLILKYYLFILKKPNYFLNYIANIFKQIYNFYRHFKYFFDISTIKLLLRHLFSKLSSTWRPLFKRFSYFGYYRTYRSKWLKK